MVCWQPEKQKSKWTVSAFGRSRPAADADGDRPVSRLRPFEQQSDSTRETNRLLDSKSAGSFLILFVIQDFSTTLTMALLVVLFLHLVRWHMQKRIERLRHMPG
jgi:hypothetical protein